MRRLRKGPEWSEETTNGRKERKMITIGKVGTDLAADIVYHWMVEVSARELHQSNQR